MKSTLPKVGGFRRENHKVCFIAGTGHSGSTLLGFILGSHSDGFYCGEAAKTRFLGDERKKIVKRVCKICGEQCPVWGDFERDEAIDLYEQVSAKVRKPLIIDSAKNVDWIRQQLGYLEHTSAQPYLIYLQRDGRAVINSRIRKYPDKKAEDLIQNWVEQIRLTNTLFDEFCGSKIKLHYEGLATHPSATVQTLCSFLAIDYQPEMLNYTQHKHHVLGGNNGTQFLVAREQTETQKTPFVTLSDCNQAYYQKHDSGIVLDLRWKQELDPAILRLFETMAGHENQSLKWDIETV